MDEKSLGKLLADCAIRQPDDRLFTDQERAQIRADLRELEPNEVHNRSPSNGRWLRRPILLGYGAIATAAMIGLVFLMPTKQLPVPQIDVMIGQSVERSSLTEKRFEVKVSTERPTWVQLVVLDELGTLRVLRTDGDTGRYIDGVQSLGSYKLIDPLPGSESRRRTHVIVLGSSEPIAIDRVAKTVPDQLEMMAGEAVTPALGQLCGNLRGSLADSCVFMPIPE